MDEGEIFVKETRGRKAKYDFGTFILGEKREIIAPTTQTVLNSARMYCIRKNLDWKFRCYTENGLIHIVRVK